jgi:hypothetical protein
LNSEQPSSDCEDYLNSEGLNEYNVDDDDDEPIYATLSSRSCCSATVAANDDFEFFPHEEKISKLVSNDDTEKASCYKCPKNILYVDHSLKKKILASLCFTDTKDR